MAWLRDPLVLFLLLGGGLAGLVALTRPPVEPAAPDTLDIVVTDVDVAWLRMTFERTWQRPPTDAELRALVERRVRDEMLYREAVALGLAEGDEALRRRLATKVAFLAKDAGAIEPSEAELAAHLAAHPERYAEAPRRGFLQVYVNADRRGAEAEAHARGLLARLAEAAPDEVATLGDRLLLETRQPPATEADIAARFGAAFADALFALPATGWHGPVVSGYGLHLVRILEDEPGTLPPLEAVRARVRADLVDARREAALESYVARLREKYDVRIRSRLLDGDAAQ